jgi:actin-like ATPase involved in cell morphogenesis
VVREFKRRFGDPTPIILGGTPIAADAIWAKLLAWILQSVTQSQGGLPAGVAVTHPANWGPYKLDLLAQAIRLADVPNPVTLSEPEAAAISYAQANKVEPGEAVAVYDLGGGTFDAAILRRTAAGFELVGRPEGIERLGGIDVDEAVFAHVKNVLGSKFDDLDHEDAGAVSAVARLRQECVAAKEALSQDTDVTISAVLPRASTEVRLTRSELEAMIRPTLAPTVEALGRAVASASLTADDLRAVLLVGGSSRIPLVGQMVGSALGAPVVTDAHPKHSVALGAALYAEGVAATRGAVQPASSKPVPLGAAKVAQSTSSAQEKVQLAVKELTESPSAPPPIRAGAKPSLWRTWPNWALQSVAVVLIGAAIVIAMVVRQRGAAGEGQIVLEPATDQGSNPFTASVTEFAAPSFDPDSEITLGSSSDGSPLLAPRLGASGAEAGGVPSYRGGTPGLFGGIKDRQSCNGEELNSLLAAEPVKSEAFAEAQGISKADVASFVEGLTPVNLRGDTRVTSHGLVDGRPRPRQSVLQAGTAVLVDQFGVPRVRCASGSPLKPAVAARAAPSYEGSQWEDFNSEHVSIIIQNTAPIEALTLIDLNTNEPFGRPVGSDKGLDGVAPQPGRSEN